MKKNQESALTQESADARSFSFVFCGQRSFDIDDSAAKQIDAQGTTFRSRPPTLLLVLPLQSTCLTTGRYRCESSRVGVLIIGCFIPDNRVLPSLLYAFILFLIANVAHSYPEKRREEGNRDDDILLSSYLWRIIRGINFSIREKESASVFRATIIPSTLPEFHRQFVGQWVAHAVFTYYFEDDA